MIFVYMLLARMPGKVIYDTIYQDNQFPRKACGVRIHNPEAWYWAANGDKPLTQAELPGNEKQTEQLQFTGAYEGCKQSPAIFTTPATPDGNAPVNAEVLVIQVAPEDIEWLDSHYEPIPPVDPKDFLPEPNFADPCSVKEFCEPQPDPECKDISVSLFDCSPLDFNSGGTQTNNVRPLTRVERSKQNLTFIK